MHGIETQNEKIRLTNKMGISNGISNKVEINIIEKYVSSDASSRISILTSEIQKLAEAQNQEAIASQKAMTASVQSTATTNAETTSKLELGEATYNLKVKKDLLGNAVAHEITASQMATLATGEHMRITNTDTIAVGANATMFGKLELRMRAAMIELNTLRWAMVNFIFIAGGLAMLASPFVLLTKYGMEWENQIKKIQIVTDGAYAGLKGYVELANTIKDIRAEGPFSAGEVAGAFFEFSKAGFSGAEATEALPAIQKLATIGFSDLGDATKIAVQTLHEFSLEGVTAEHVVNTIAMAANKSAMDVSTFGAAMAYVGPIAANLGLSLDETAATMALLSNAGLKGSKAGTALRQVLSAISDPTDGAKNRMRELGMAFYDAEGNIKDLSAVFASLSAGMAGLTDQGKAEALGDMFGVRSRTAVMALLDVLKEGGDGIVEFRKILAEDEGYSDRKNEEAMTTTANQWKLMWNEMKEDFEPMSSAFNKMLNTMLTDSNKFEDERDKYAQEKHEKELARIKERAAEEVKKREDLLEIPIIGETLAGPSAQEELTTYINNINAIEDGLNTWADGLRETSMQQDSIMNSGFLMWINRVASTLSSPFRTEKNVEPEIEDNTGLGSSEEEAAKAILEAQRLQREAFQEDLQAMLDEVSGNEVSSNMKEVLSVIEELTELEEGAIGATIGMKDAMSDLHDELNTLVTTISDAESNLEKEERVLAENKNTVNDWKEDVSDAKDELATYNAELSVTEDAIKVLTNTRFTGQTDMDKLITDVTRYNKEQELAAYGISDAYTWLQTQLSAAQNGFENVEQSVKKVNEATEDGTNSYTAWQETIQEFIRSSIVAGNDLSSNVTGTVKAYQGMLLATNRFTDSQSEESNYVSLLKDAYDVYYGGMEDSVSNAIQIHEDEKNGVSDTSESVIKDLKNQWIAQSLVEQSIKDTEEEVADLQASLKAAESVYDIQVKKVDSLTESVDSLTSSYHSLFEELSNFNKKEIKVAKDNTYKDLMTDAQLMETDYYKAIEAKLNAQQQETYTPITPFVGPIQQNNQSSKSDNSNSLIIDVKIAADMIADQIQDTIMNLLYKDGVK